MRRLMALLLLLPLVVACTLVASPSSSPSAETQEIYNGLDLEPLGTYQASFEVRFEGTARWVLQWGTRTDGSAIEYGQHLEGVSESHNLGDVRVVIEGDTARMRGPATDDECVQFPADLDLAPSFLTPDDLIAPEGFEEPLTALGTETIAGFEVTHYSLRQATLDDWRDVEVDVWVDDSTGALLRYDLQAAGPDPLFDAGDGLLSGQFLVSDVGPQAVQPVAGCEIDLPLPPDATRLVRLPGLVAFESGSSPDEVAVFYMLALAEAEWEPVDEPQVGEHAVLLTYRRGGQVLNIDVESSSKGAHVELLLGEQ